MSRAPAAAASATGAADPARFTPLEVAAVKSLLRADALYYAIPARACPAEALPLMVGTTPRDLHQYWPNMGVTQSGRGKEHLSRVFDLLDVLKTELLCHVGDDVIAGTIFVPAADESAAAAPAAASAAAAPAPPPLSFTVEAHGQPITFPIVEDDAVSLYWTGEQSSFGKEGHGDVQDVSVRQSRELPADSLKLPDFLQNPRVHFPEMVRNIVTRLCPTAEKIAIVPYKLVCYAEGDFFKAHRDSVKDEREFGTLAIHLPCVGDYEDATAIPDPGRFTYSASSGGGSGDDADEAAADDGEAEQDAEAAATSPQAPPPPPRAQRAVGGALRFYLGRALAEEFVGDRGCVKNQLWSRYGRPDHSDRQLVASVLLQNYTALECLGQHSAAAGAATAYAQPLPPPPQTSRDAAATAAAAAKSDVEAAVAAASRESALRCTNSRSRGASTAGPHMAPLPRAADRTHTPLHFAAWLTSVLHDVRALKRGYRFVMTYKMMRVGEVALRVPREPVLTGIMERLVTALREAREPAVTGIMERVVAALREAPAPRRLSDSPTCVGVLLRHAYPRAGLSVSMLKGVDAVCWHVMAARFECVLAPVLVVKNLDTGSPFMDDGTIPHVLLSSTYPQGFDPAEYIARELLPHAPYIDRAVWMELGFGDILGGGSATGNADCGADWWYRNAAIVCTLRPNAWQHRRWAFLAAEHGHDGNVFKRLSGVYAAFRNVVSFM